MKYWLNTKGFPIGSDPKRLDRIGWSNSEEILISAHLKKVILDPTGNPSIP
jgi:hypothetical protein